MSKGKYEDWLTPDGLMLLEAWARDGLTEAQIAHNCGCASSTLREWKNKFAAISAALKKGKEVVDIEVENALFKKAMGYTVSVKKTFKVRKIDYDAMGRKVCEREELVSGYDEVHIPADTTAQIFWLKNRRRDVWKDRPVDDSDSAALIAARALLEGVKSAF